MSKHPLAVFNSTTLACIIHADMIRKQIRETTDPARKKELGGILEGIERKIQELETRANADPKSE